MMNQHVVVGKLVAKPKIGVLDWSMIAPENELSHDYFKLKDESIRPQFKSYDTIQINFKPSDKPFGNIESFTFNLADSKFKTIGTYVTRLNKIASGISPNSHNNYAKRVSGLKLSNYGIKRTGNNSIKIFNLGNETESAAVALLENGNCDITMTGDYSKLEYFIMPIVTGNYLNRLYRLVQFDSNNAICAEPEFYLRFESCKITLGNSIPENLKPYRLQLIAQLIDTDINVNTAEIMQLQPELIGGGTRWLGDFLLENGKMNENKSIELKF